MFKAIDSHAHVLYALDDGPKKPAESLEMLRIAASQGIERMIATPHYLPHRFGADPEKWEEIFQDVEKMAESVGITLYRGSELRFGTPYIDALKSGEAKTLAGGRYLLIDCPFGQRVYNMQDLLYDLDNLGYTVIIAHPERSLDFLRSPGLVAELAADGVLFQVTASSFLGKNGLRAKSLAKKLAEADLIFAVASDCHSPQRRAPVLKPCGDYVARRWGERYAEKVFYKNPMKIIQNTL